MRQLKPLCLAILVMFPTLNSFAENVQPPMSAVEVNAVQASITQQLDAMSASFYKSNEPGATVIVTKAGNTLLRKGYGLASVVEKRAMQADDVMRLGSVSKQFTAVGILMLMEEGKLSLSDNLQKFFPDYPESGKKITVEHLLTHTAGIPNYTSKPGFVSTIAKDMTVDEMIASFKNDPLEFEPGSTWNYSNSGYFLLGAIIEKASGLPYAKFVEQRIFVPLGMKNTAYEGFERSQHSHAAGHAPGANGFEPSSKISMTQPYAAGSLTSTVDDLAVWDAAISAGKLLKASSWKRAFTNYKLTNGKNTDYGYGWSIGELEGSTMISHGGGINGFATFALRLPKEKIYVAVLTNAESGLAASSMVASRLAAAAMSKTIPEFKAITLDAKVLDQYVGVYKIDEKNRRQFVRDGDKLIMSRTNGPTTVLQAYSTTGFFKDNTSLLRVEFVKNPQGAVIDALVYQNGTVTHHERTSEVIAQESPAVEVAAEVFDAYVGDYELAPNFILNIRREGNRFVAQATGQGSIYMTAVAQNAFVSKEVGAKVTFEKSADGKVNQLILSQGGRDIPAKRVMVKKAEAKTSAVKISAEAFDQYVGQYQLAPNFILTVSRDGERFLTQATGQGTVEIMAIEPDLFEAVGVAAKLRFEKATDGKVTQVVLLQGGREMPAKKLP
ncbi:serine hydrolase [Undibacterium fentianense]|uniref:Serine hydrolase n=1 Tax=Undibacterium fentianense TaxID=2828728 RepID=A0A941E3F5_9BURK|nr:serine hydrolase [Undibacterium fentianense]MBR7799003.1 serine hydrolase [Undibacterium fentianense]